MTTSQGASSIAVPRAHRGYALPRRGVLSAVGLGSVSDTLVHNLHCPTVVVKPPAAEERAEAACAATAVHGAKP